MVVAQTYRIRLAFPAAPSPLPAPLLHIELALTEQTRPLLLPLPLPNSPQTEPPALPPLFSLMNSSLGLTSLFWLHELIL